MPPASTKTCTSFPAEPSLRSRRAPLAALLPALALLVGLAGCGGGGEDAAPGGTSSSAAPVLPTPHEQARMWLRAGKVQDALARFDALRKASPEDVDAHRGWQDAMSALGRAEESVAEYAALRRERPESAIAAYLHGRAAIADPETSAEAFQRARDLDPRSPWAALGLAHVARSRNDSFKAIQVLREAATAAPENADLHLALGRIYFELGMLRDAEDSYRAALGRRSTDPDVMANLGEVLVHENRFDEATALLERSLSMEPERTVLLPALAAAYSGNKKYVEAAAILEKARAAGVSYNPDFERDVRSKGGLPSLPPPPAAAAAGAPSAGAPAPESAAQVTHPPSPVPVGDGATSPSAPAASTP
ncbi:tetratricopeptide repeat protein [Myxococcota bacterium]|nr:tetratricopeptide repeat protein [Myxococcota bacterium]